jgi:membrane-associated phospholipid phosphatase
MNLSELLDHGIGDFLQAVDTGSCHAFQTMRTARLDHFWIFVTHLGDRSVLTPVVTFALGCFAARRRWRPCLVILALVFTGLFVEENTKVWIQRPRPDVADPAIPRPDGYSFPSGHALNSSAIYLGLALLAARRVSRTSLAALLIAASVLLFMGIGFSRMYLGAHWMSDVLGGWAFGIGLAFTCRWLDGVLSPQPGLAAPTETRK